VYARHDPCQHLFLGRERSSGKVAFLSLDLEKCYSLVLVSPWGWIKFLYAQLNLLNVKFCAVIVGLHVMRFEQYRGERADRAALC
jgi:hypothetical protein